MYPSPASAYRPQFTAQISNPNSQPTPPPHPQFTPHLSNSNLQPTPPPPPPSASALAYPHPQYPSHPNIPAVPYHGHPGQPPPFPQSTPYATPANAASTVNPQINNINGFLPVSTAIDRSIYRSMLFLRRIILITIAI